MVARLMGQKTETHIWGVFTLAAILLGLNGCASMSEQECLAADWRLVGYEDATQGRNVSTISAHRKACARINVVPDLDRYQQGYREGARQYCVRPTAYQLGINGGKYEGICPADLEPAFLRAYRDGQALYAITRNIEDQQDSLRSYQSDIAGYQQEIAQHELDIIDPASTANERRDHLRALEKLRRKIADAEIEITHIERNINNLQFDYRDLQQHHQRLGY